MSESDAPVLFDQLGLPAPLLAAVAEVGYESPSPIQAACIPPLLEGCDIVGQAQTGTGKTAAFSLPLLARIKQNTHATQLLVLAPTRELAIQVAEAMQTYARHLKDFHVLPIYGGQSYTNQLRSLKRGVQVVVGTPGRVMDHMRRGTLKLDALQALVLDEADEMLRMGFIDDVEWVLEHVPSACQIALFSATMPREIRHVASQHLKDPVEIKIAAATATASTIRQRCLYVNHREKMDALTRILEIEDYDGVIIFVRTKTQTTELADKLNARGFIAEALNGDVPQQRRETIVAQLKSAKVDILVATDVVARGLDVERVSHVINYDIPYDAESYVHRIGRTGRAGREGDAILFVTGRERRMLQSIQKSTKQSIEEMRVPGAEEINASRVGKFKQRIIDTLNHASLAEYRAIVDELLNEHALTAGDIAAALAFLQQGERPLLLDPAEITKLQEVGAKESGKRQKDKDARSKRDRVGGRGEDRPARLRAKSRDHGAEAMPLTDFPDVKMLRYQVDVGYKQNAKPGNIVGAIANEGELESRYIGHIEIFDDFSTVDLPDGMPKETFQALQNARVFKHKLNIKRFKPEQTDAANVAKADGRPPAAKKSKAKKANGAADTGAKKRKYGKSKSKAAKKTKP